MVAQTCTGPHGARWPGVEKSLDAARMSACATALAADEPGGVAGKATAGAAFTLVGSRTCAKIEGWPGTSAGKNRGRQMSGRRFGIGKWAGAAALWFATAAIASAQAFTVYTLPASYSQPKGITAGPDGALWFTEYNNNKIGRISTSGVITEYPVVSAASYPYSITAGPDGALWFTEYHANNIGRITTAGAVTEFAVPTPLAFPLGITNGPDGALWFTESGTNNIGRVTTAGAFLEYAIPTQPSGAYGIVTGPDGNLWFTESAGNNIAQVTPQGIITEFAVPTSGSAPSGILNGPDGGLWFTEWAGNKIGRSDTSGNIVEYTVPTGISYPLALTVGTDGAMWFTEGAIRNQIGRVTVAGAITEYPVGPERAPGTPVATGIVHTPTATPYPAWLAAGPDGGIWFTEGIGAVVRFAIPPVVSKLRHAL